MLDHAVSALEQIAKSVIPPQEKLYHILADWKMVLCQNLYVCMFSTVVQYGHP